MSGRDVVNLFLGTFLKFPFLSVQNRFDRCFSVATELLLSIDSVFGLVVLKSHHYHCPKSLIKTKHTILMSAGLSTGASALETQPPADATSAAPHLCSDADSMVTENNPPLLQKVGVCSLSFSFHRAI